MEIKYQSVVLRDYRESDIDDDVRWNTTETAWALWDAPWEMEEELRNFDEAEFRAKCRKGLENAQQENGQPSCFEIDTADGVHIGGVNAYVIDDEYEWTKLKADEPITKDMKVALGIDLCESAYWSGGWGTQALAAFVLYWLDQGISNLYTQTWSGNVRMVGLAEKLGFREVKRKQGKRQVRGETYDGLTFQLDTGRFRAFLEKTSG